MPQVPVYGPPQAAPQPLPGVRVGVDVPEDAFGAGPAAEGVRRELRGASDDILRIQAQERRKANSIAAMDAANQASIIQTNLLYDPKEGFLSRQGKNALETGVPEKTAASFDAEVKRLAAGLSNDEQRFLFQNHVASLYDDMNKSIQHHIFKQSKVYANETLTTRAKLIEDDVGKAYQDPKALEDLVVLRFAVDRDIASVNGGDGNAVKALNLESGSAMRSKAILLMLGDGNYAAARKHFDEHASEFTLNDRVRMQNALKEGEVKERSMSLADALVAGVGPEDGKVPEVPPTEGEAMGAMKAQAEREKWPADLRDAVRARIVQHYADEDRITRRNVEDTYNKAAALLDENAKLPIPRPAEDVIAEAMPGAMNDPKRLPPDVTKTLLARHTSPVNNATAWKDFIMLSDLDLARMSRSEFDAYWVRFDEEHRARAEAKWEAARDVLEKGRAAASAKSVSTLNFDDYVKNTFRQYVLPGKDPSKYGAADEVMLSRFYNAADKAVREAERKGPLAPGDVRDIIERVAVREVGGKKVFALDPGDLKKLAAPLREIPAEAQLDLVRAAEALGSPMSVVGDSPEAKAGRERMRKAYAAYQAGDMVRVREILRGK